MRSVVLVLASALCAMALSGCLGEEDDVIDAGAGSGGQGAGGGVFGSGGSGGGGPPSGGSGGETDAGPPAFPSANPDCADDAVRIEAELAPGGPYTRSQPATITYRVFAHGVVQIFGRAPDGGDFADAGEGRLTFNAGGGEDDPLGANVPLWQGDYRFELAAQDEMGCVGTTSVDVPLVGDLVVGDSNGALHVRGSDGRWVVSIGMVGTQSISALIVAPDAERQLIAGFRSGIDGPPFIARLDASGAILTRFSDVNLQGEPLFESGGPRQLYYDSDSGDVLCDGVPNGAVLRFNLLGDYLGEVRVPVGDSDDHVALGFSRQEGQILVGTSADDRVYALPEGESPAELYVDTGGSFNELYAVGVGLDDQLLVAHTLDNYNNQITSFGPGGQELRKGSIGALEPEHIIRFRDGYLITSGFDPIRRLDPHLRMLEPTDDGDRWDDFGGFGFGSITSVVWLNASPPN